MSLPRIIALTGFIGAGKTSIARILERDYGYARKRFAGPLKDMLRAIGLTDDYVDGDKKETPHPLLCHRTPRHAMQTLGTEWGRNCIGPDFLVEAWRQSIKASQRVVVDDCRFPNEADAVCELGGMVWWVERPGVGASDHSSENQRLPWHLAIRNATDLVSLEAAVAETMAALNLDALNGPMGRPLG